MKITLLTTLMIILLNETVLGANLVQTVRYNNPSAINKPYITATSLAVSNNHIYLAGLWGVSYKGEGGTIYNEDFGTYWVDGMQYFIGQKDPRYEAVSINDIAISGNDIYLAGVVTLKGTYSGGRVFQARVWKNGKEIPLQLKGDGNSKAVAIAIANDKIYVVGQWNNKATVWEDGLPRALSGDDTIAQSIIINGKDIYVSGYSRYWKNDVPYEIQTPNNVNYYLQSISVSGNDVYSIGNEQATTRPSRGMYFKNGEIQYLSQNRDVEYIDSITVDGSNVYIAGTIKTPNGEVAAVWINGEVIKLSDHYSGPTKIVKAGKFLYVSGYDVICLDGDLNAYCYKRESSAMLWKIAL